MDDRSRVVSQSQAFRPEPREVGDTPNLSPGCGEVTRRLAGKVHQKSLVKV